MKLNPKTAYERLDEIEKRLDELYDNTYTLKQLLDKYIGMQTNITQLEHQRVEMSLQIDKIAQRLNAIAPEHKPKKKKVWINVYYTDYNQWGVSEHDSREAAAKEVRINNTVRYHIVGMEAEVPDGR